MARRGPQANLRARAIELFAFGRLGDEKAGPASIASALGVTEDELLRWRSNKSFNDAVAARARQLYREAFPFVARRVIEQAEAGQSSQQALYLKYLEHLETIEAQNSSDRWVVGWSTAKTATPEAPVPADTDPGE